MSSHPPFPRFFTPVPASYFTCPSQTSPMCPLKTLFYTKLPFTCHNQLRFLLFPSLNWNLIHPQRFHFLFFSFFLKKGWLFLRLLSHWNLQITLQPPLYNNVLSNLSFHRYTPIPFFGFHYENQNFFWSDSCPYTGGPLGRMNCIKLDGAYVVGYSILRIFHRSKVLF